SSSWPLPTPSAQPEEAVEADDGPAGGARHDDPDGVRADAREVAAEDDPPGLVGRGLEIDDADEPAVDIHLCLAVSGAALGEPGDVAAAERVRGPGSGDDALGQGAAVGGRIGIDRPGLRVGD